MGKKKFKRMIDGIEKLCDKSMKKPKVYESYCGKDKENVDEINQWLLDLINQDLPCQRKINETEKRY